MKIWLDRLSDASADPLLTARHWFAGADWLAADPARADVVVLFTDGYVSTAQWRAERGRHQGRECLLYSGADRPNPALRGLYPSLDREGAGRLPYPYFTSYHPAPEATDLRPASLRSRLVGFRGRLATHPVRERLRALLGADVVRDPARDVLPDAAVSSHCGYCDELADTVFSLCPRGFGASSYRLYESLAQGCVPVIISDDFQPPPGPEDWSEFSLRVSEHDLDGLPARLAELLPEADRMSRAARMAWSRHFSPEALRERFPADVATVLAAQEISWREQLRMLRERYHVAAMLKTGRSGRA